MMDPVSMYEACHTSLVRCLYTVAEHCPELPSNSPPLHRLRNLVQVLLVSSPPGTPSAQVQAADIGFTISQSLNMLSSAQELLNTLHRGDPSGRITDEMQETLSDTLVELKARMGAALRQQKATRMRGLYVIIDPQVTNGRDPLEIARAAINGGSRVLQLRDKLRDKGEVLPLASQLQTLCQQNDVDLIINDHADMASLVGSAGLHVGQTDLPVEKARRVLAPEQVLGRSNHEMEELAESQEMGADHVAFGAIYATGTKGVGRPPQGVERLRHAKDLTQLPLVAIGGITADNVGPVVEAGADAICVTAAVGLAQEPEAAARRLVEAISAAGGRI